VRDNPTVRSHKGRIVLAAAAVVTVVAATTAWWLADKDQQAEAGFCSLVLITSTAYVIPTASIQEGWPKAATYEARTNGKWSPLRNYPGKNRLQIVGVSAPDQSSMPISVRVLDESRRTLWTGQLTAHAPPSESNGKGCGTYYQAGVALDVNARELHQRPVPKSFRF
jgi:hypothetical protein